MINETSLGRFDRERDVVRYWRRGYLSAGSVHAYLLWVRRFRRYCQTHGLDEYEQLTQAGAFRFGQQYVGPRMHGPAAASTRRSACHAIHAWACALRALRAPLSPWRPPHPEPCLPPVLGAYLQYRRSHRGVAPSTLVRDRDVAQCLLRFLKSRRRSVHQVRAVDLDAFVAQQTREVSTRTVVERCSALRSFLRYLHLSGRIRRDFLDAVRAPRYHVDRPPRALPWADVRRILRAVAQDTPPGKRDFAMLLLMATYGLGGAEAVHLSLDGIDWLDQVLRVQRPKTGHHVELPLLPPVACALARYLRHERPSPTPHRRVFVSTRLPYDPLTSAAIRHRLQLYARRARLDGTMIGAHAFRHSHATRQVDAGVHPQVLGDILGHRRPSSTSAYVRVAMRRLRRIALPVPQ